MTKPLALRKVLTPLWSTALIALAILSTNMASAQETAPPAATAAVSAEAPAAAPADAAPGAEAATAAPAEAAPAATPKCGDKGFECNKGDVSWMMVATAFVLFMTVPG